MNWFAMVFDETMSKQAAVFNVTHERLRVSAHTLGCKVNQYDTDHLLAELERRGCETVTFGEPADVCVINSCTVTHTGETKSLQMLRRVKNAGPQTLLAVCGCLTKTNAPAILKAGADIVFDARNPDELITWLSAKQLSPKPLCPDSPAGPERQRGGYRRVRAYIKIQDGCDRFCSYCIVPHARGPLTSRPLDEILSEAQILTGQGVREIVLTGIQAAAYGNDKDNFPSVIKSAASLPGLARLRLGSIEPYGVTDEFLDAISSPVVCPHFHLSLQSGCGKTLQAMNRRYMPEQYAGLVENIRRQKPGAAITTDIMVGFPGETDADFEESLRFAESIKFSRMHVFIYSPRKGTPAAEYPNQVSQSVKAERGRKMRELAGVLAFNYLRDNIGRTEQVLFETKHQEGSEDSESGGNGRPVWWEGHTPTYITVRAIHNGDLTNVLMNVKLDEIKKGIMYGGIAINSSISRNNYSVKN